MVFLVLLFLVLLFLMFMVFLVLSIVGTSVMGIVCALILRRLAMIIVRLVGTK